MSVARLLALGARWQQPRVLTIPLAPPTMAPTDVVAAIAAGVDSSPPANASRALIAFLVIVVIGVPVLFVWARLVRPMHLALGFAATALLWVIGYAVLLQPGQLAGEALFGLMLLVLFAAGFVAGRFGDATVRPVSVGLVSAAANLLVVGAFLRDEQHGSRWAPVAWVIGLFVVSAGLSWVGGALGRRAHSRTALPPATELFAMVMATTVFLLIVLGGVLTGREAGLAVPDWPNSFGHNMLLYPVSEMRGGVFYEHAHRLYGMLVGATAAVLVVVVRRDATSRWVRGLSVALLLMICVQGFLGGMRVTGRPTLDVDRVVLAPSTALAVVHGVFAQIVFAASLVIAAATSRLWRSGTQPIVASGTTLDRELTLVLPFALVVQLILGALYRHLQPSGGASAPGHPMWAFHAHITMAIVVTGLVIFAGGRAWSRALHPRLRQLGAFVVVVTAVQLTLGVIAVALVWTRKDATIPTMEVVVTTLHQGTGALLLGTATLLAAWSRRLLAAGEAGETLIATR